MLIYLRCIIYYDAFEKYNEINYWVEEEEKDEEEWKEEDEEEESTEYGEKEEDGNLEGERDYEGEDKEDERNNLMDFVIQSESVTNEDDISHCSPKIFGPKICWIPKNEWPHTFFGPPNLVTP